MATFYTTDHEWIDFHGTVAYTGVCSFKLIGFKEIHQLSFNAAPGFLKRGELIATIKYNDYQIEARMPVDGKIAQINEELSGSRLNRLLQNAETSAWLAQIIPAQPY